MRVKPRIHSTLCRILAACAVWASILAGQSLFAAENVWTVQKLNDSQPWDGFVGSPLPIKVEGRLGTSGGSQFRLAKCDCKFTIDPDKFKLAISKENTKAHVELRGHFKKNGAKIEFAVDELKVVPTYVDQLEIKASKLKLPTAEDWIELGHWGMERANFYEDEELAKKSKKAYSNAIEIERHAIKTQDPESRFALAKKAEELGLPDTSRLELVHEGLQLKWKAMQKSDAADPTVWRQFALTLQKQLPQSGKPVSSFPPELKESYERDPDSTYRNADSDTRTLLHRMFYVAVVKKTLIHGASKDGRDGATIADLIDTQIPEEHMTAEAFRSANLDFRFANIAVATRAEAEALAQTYRERAQPDQSRQVLLQWIKAHEKLRRDVGILGMMELADEYLTLLNDEPKAVEWLSDANKIDPKFEPVKTRLSELGYQQINGHWTKSKKPIRPAAKNDTPPPTEISMGMSASDLRKVLGQPRALARTITARGITEVWSFGPVGSSQLVVRLEQKNRDGEPRIVSYSGK